MAARSKARKRALDILFASELRSEDPVVALDRAIEAGEGPTNDYTSTLVRGVVEHLTRIDEVLTTYSKGWTLAPDARGRPQRAAHRRLRAAVG